MTWQEVIDHPSLQNLPFKIELNKDGVIEMSPATNWHGFYQMEVGSLLNQMLPTGRAVSEASVQTSDGVRVADVVWATREFLSLNREQTPFSSAPVSVWKLSAPATAKKKCGKKLHSISKRGQTKSGYVHSRAMSVSTI